MSFMVGNDVLDSVSNPNPPPALFGPVKMENVLTPIPICEKTERWYSPQVIEAVTS